MSEVKGIREKVSPGKFMSICLMIFCLVLLTSLNYFLYPAGTDTTANIFGVDTEETESDFPPSGATEEKSCNSGFSIAEEIIHEGHPSINFEAVNQLYLHHIAEAQKIEMFHPELILPPPKHTA